MDGVTRTWSSLAIAPRRIPTVRHVRARSASLRTSAERPERHRAVFEGEMRAFEREFVLESFGQLWIDDRWIGERRESGDGREEDQNVRIESHHNSGNLTV